MAKKDFQGISAVKTPPKPERQIPVSQVEKILGDLEKDIEDVKWLDDPGNYSSAIYPGEPKAHVKLSDIRSIFAEYRSQLLSK